MIQYTVHWIQPPYRFRKRIIPNFCDLSNQIDILFVANVMNMTEALLLSGSPNPIINAGFIVSEFVIRSDEQDNSTT